MPRKDSEARRDYQREYKRRRRLDPTYRENRETKRSNNLRRRYGLTIEEWDAMLIEQAGRCAICGDPMMNPLVDHDHAEGAVRELLCNHCNVLLGKARERPEILASAIAYLDRHHPERHLT